MNYKKRRKFYMNQEIKNLFRKVCTNQLPAYETKK